MNAASLAKSQRLQRVDQLLSDGREYSTMQIVRRAKVCAVNSIVSELRVGGRIIHCRREKDVWYYWRDLVAEKREAEKVAA